MLLGCCHCGGEESVPSVASVTPPPSVNTPSSLYPSNSTVSVLPPNVNPICGACYNMPNKWTVEFHADWFVYNPGGGLGFPTFEDCQPPNSIIDYTLNYSTEKPVRQGLTACASWKSSQLAANVSTYACDPSDPFFPVCGPDILSRPRVQLTAYNVEDGGVNATHFFLTYSWAMCEYLYSYVWDWWVVRVKPETISCVRAFEAQYWTEEDNYPVRNGPFPYTLSNTNTGWQKILVEPA